MLNLQERFTNCKNHWIKSQWVNNLLGLGVFDCLTKDMPDPETGEIYPAISCCNNSEMAARCVVPGADKVIWAIKASAQFNSDCAFLLREGFHSGRIRLLTTELEARELLSALRGYKSLSESKQMQLKLPYLQTELLINELTKLQHEESGGKVKIYEKSGMRKDRYSSLSYNYFVATQLEAKLNKRNSANIQSANSFVIKPPMFIRKAVSRTNGDNNPGWY